MNRGVQRIFRDWFQHLYSFRNTLLKQISNHVFCDDFIAGLKLDTRLMPNPYHDMPYMIIENFLTPGECEEIVAYTKALNDAEQAQVKRLKLGSVVDPEVDEEIRKTAIHKLPESLTESYRRQFMERQHAIETFFATALTTATDIQVLEYTKGAFYIKHADDSNELVNDDGETVGFVQVAPQRKITTVLFVTSHSDHTGDGNGFEGGELLFNYLCDVHGHPVTLRPKAGDMVVFPSNPIFSHEVKPVKSGYRLTMVQWHNAIIQ